MSGWFYLLANTHILSFAGPNYDIGPTSASVDLNYSNTELQVSGKVGDSVLYTEKMAVAGKWVFVALGYADLQVRLCAGGLQETTLCIDQGLDTELAFERVLVCIEERVTGVDLRIRTSSVLTYNEANREVQALQTACQTVCPLLPLSPARQLGPTHYSALTYQAYMPAAAYYSSCNSYYNRYRGWYTMCYSYTVPYFYYYTFVNNHIATTSISVYVTGKYLEVTIYKYWGGQYREVWRKSGSSSVGNTLYPANLASYGGITGLYSVKVYGYDGSYSYVVSVRIACNSATVETCSCAAGMYPNPYTSSCSVCGATDYYCKAYASLGCLPFAFRTVQYVPSGFSCSRCSSSDQTLDTSTGNCMPWRL